MDILSIEQLKVMTTIGVYDWERKVKQTLYFDLQWKVDVAKVTLTDDLSDTFDYVEVSDVLQKFLEENSFLLIETLAEKVAQFLLSRFKFEWLKLKLTKPGVISNAKNVSITIERRTFIANNRERNGYENRE
jgi:dihydroneopterin aldolase